MYASINRTALRDDCPVSAGTLRALCKRGHIPGFYSGNRFLINLDELPAALARLCDEQTAGPQEKQK